MCSRRAVRTLSSDSSALGIVAALAFVLHLGFYEGFGYFRDELYFLACSRHLAWGYVDHPPGVAVVAWLSRAALGDTLLAVRFVPILFATAQVLLAGLTARAMGGRRFAQVLSAISVLAAPIYFGSYLNTDMFVNLGWSACAYVIARILAGGSPRLWVVVGLLAGLAFEGKHAIVFFAAAFLAALLFSPQRRLLLEPWLWIGIALATLIALPNVAWEYANGWPTYELLSNIAASNKNVVPGPGAYLLANVEYLGPLTFPLWAAGALWCAFSRAGRPFRAFALTWLIAFTIFVALNGKAYYLTAIYSTLLAAGGVAFEQWLVRKATPTAMRWRLAIPAVIVVGCAVFWPFAMPMMPVEEFLRYATFLHLGPPKTETQPLGALPQQYADMMGWPEMVAEVARVYAAVPDADRASCGILASNYGEAGAIDEFGPQVGLPPALSGHQNYWLWGPRGYTGNCLIVVGGRREALQRRFAEVTQMGEADHPFAVPAERHLPIWMVRGPKAGSFQQLWPALKNWM